MQHQIRSGVATRLCPFTVHYYIPQVPTSLLAMVDSSIGGKTGLDTLAGKNLVGAFHRPLCVLVDPCVLVTLPKRELFNGLAEAIKTGVIWKESLFSEIESNVDEVRRTTVNYIYMCQHVSTCTLLPCLCVLQQITSCDLNVLESVIRQSIGIKAHVVVEDEREGGLRGILNFGHTVGHAIEALMQPALLHGECVAIGMVLEAVLSRSLGHLSNSSVIRRIDNCCRG